jgi:MFS family permease
VHAPSDRPHQPAAFTPDSGRAWVRLCLALVIASIGAVGMWTVVVVLPTVQVEFAATRGAVSLAFTMTMMGFGLGGVVMGRITDRFGIVAAMGLSIAFLGGSYVLAGLSVTLWQFIAVYFLIGLGTSATFAPLMAEASHWFERYRGLAGQLGCAVGRLAHHPYCDRDFLRGDNDAVAIGAAQPDW